MTRHLEDWISSFEAYTESMSTPRIFRRWAAISLVAAAMERKTWLETAVGTLYPNLYIFFVAPPAVGKTILTSLVWRTIKQLKDHKVASSSVTIATLIEELGEAQRFKSTPTGAIEFNSLYIISNELGVLLPEWGGGFMSKLTDIYDCHAYSEKRRNSKHNADIKRPQLNILAATQPGYLSTILPEVAWEQGFMTRCILVYSDEIIRGSLFARTEHDAVQWEKIMKDLQTIGGMYGEYRFTPEAERLIDNFYMGGHKETALMHPKLQHYNTRRPAHIMKLMMVAAASASDEYVLDVEHFQTAIDWLVEAEHYMPEIFKAMNTGGDNSIMKDAWYYVYRQQAESGKAIHKQQLVAFLAQRVPAQKIGWIIEIMESANLLKPEVSSAGTLYRANGSPG